MSQHAKVYTEEELALFARYVAARADLRPKGCTGAEMCWVEKGPPGLGGNHTCLGCRASVMGGGPGRQPPASMTRFAR